jgi:hypothetical protein
MSVYVHTPGAMTLIQATVIKMACRNVTFTFFVQRQCDKYHFDARRHAQCHGSKFD